MPLLVMMGLTVLLIVGCGKTTEVSYAPQTAEKAGIEVLDSNHCETCHTSAEIISAYEKPKTEGESGEGAGG